MLRPVNCRNSCWRGLRELSMLHRHMVITISDAATCEDCPSKPRERSLSPSCRTAPLPILFPPLPEQEQQLHDPSELDICNALVEEQRATQAAGINERIRVGSEETRRAQLCWRKGGHSAGGGDTKHVWSGRHVMHEAGDNRGRIITITDLASGQLCHCHH